MQSVPAIDWNAACARLRARRVRDMALIASHMRAECGVDSVSVDGGSKSPESEYDASPSMFDNGGTIEALERNASVVAQLEGMMK